jgi:hypothetical protein
MKRTSLQYMIAFMSCLFTLASAQDSTTVFPAVVEGTFQTGEFFGPPGYGKNSKTDKIESCYYLQLPTPLMQQQGVSALPPDVSMSAGLTFYMQLIVHPSKKVKISSYLGHRVRLTGNLISASSGQHRTSILLDVSKVELIKKWR